VTKIDAWDCVMPRQEILDAHRHSIRHREEVEQSEECGCFYCMRSFAPGEILDWVDDSIKPGQIEETALCPYCGIDSVLGSKSGYPMTQEFLEEMNDHWFH
jgi:hypothetical protein